MSIPPIEGADAQHYVLLLLLLRSTEKRCIQTIEELEFRAAHCAAAPTSSL